MILLSVWKTWAQRCLFCSFTSFRNKKKRNVLKMKEHIQLYSIQGCRGVDLLKLQLKHNFNPASSTSCIQLGECSQCILQSLKITAHSSRSSLLCKFPSFSGVRIGGVELRHSKNPTESHRVHKLEGFRGCPARIKKVYTAWLEKEIHCFFFHLIFVFQHEGSKIFIQEELES